MAETVKVRIAVVANDDGSWGACGWNASEGDEWEFLEDRITDFHPGAAKFYVTAELPIPVKVPTVTGTVEEG